MNSLQKKIEKIYKYIYIFIEGVYRSFFIFYSITFKSLCINHNNAIRYFENIILKKYPPNALQRLWQLTFVTRNITGNLLKEVMTLIDNNEILHKLERVIDLHETMKNSYFFSPPFHAHARRIYEEQHSLFTEFNYEGDVIEIVQKTSCSCHNIYYSISYKINGIEVKKDIRFIKRIMKEISGLV